MGNQFKRNQINDIGPLASLNNLRRLYLENNPLSQESTDIHIPNLNSRGVVKAQAGAPILRQEDYHDATRKRQDYFLRLGS